MDAKEVAAITAAVQEQLAIAGAERARGQRPNQLSAVTVPVAISMGRGREATIQFQLDPAVAKDPDTLMDALDEIEDAGFTIKSWPKKREYGNRGHHYSRDRDNDRDDDDDDRSSRRNRRR